MHDGSLASLDDVIHHYVSGGKQHPHRSPLIQPLDLNESEQKALRKFLEALTDQSFVTNTKFLNQ